MDQIRIEEGKGPGYALLEVAGIVNFRTYPEFEERAHSIIKAADLVVDLGKVTNLSSLGLGVLVSALEEGREYGHRLYILNPSKLVCMALESVGFSGLFSIIASVDEVIAS